MAIFILSVKNIFKASLMSLLLSGTAPAVANTVTDHLFDISKSQSDFMTEKLRLRSEIANSGESGTEPHQAAVYTYARFLMHHGFWTEVNAILDSVKEVGVVDIDEDIRLLSSYMDPYREISLEDFTAYSGNSVLYKIMDAILFSNSTETLEGEDVLAFTTSLPPDAQGKLLPELMRLYIDARDIDAIRGTGRLLSQLNGFSNSSADLYLQAYGQAALENTDAAKNLYLQALEGRDDWAQKSRLSYVSILMSQDQNEEARDFLSKARYLWRGDMLELEMLRQIYQVEKALGNPIASIFALSEISHRFPDLAKEYDLDAETWEVLDEYYTGLSTNFRDLEQRLEDHIEISLTFGGDPRFIPLSERFAVFLSSLGAFSLASDEYQEIYDSIQRNPRLSRNRKLLSESERIRHDLAESLILAGQYERSLDILEAPAQNLDFYDRRQRLIAKASLQIGNFPQAYDTEPLEKTMIDHLVKARSAFRLGKMREAFDAYSKIDVTDLGRGDHLLFAASAYRIDEFKEEMFPDMEMLSQNDKELLESLSLTKTEIPALSRLSMEGFLERLDRIERP